VALTRQPVEIAEVIATAIETASPRLEERQHELVVDVPRAGLPVDGDPARLAQAVGNVLTNAAKYTEPRGRITVSAAREGDAVVIAVVDTGIGIAPEMLPRIFDVFAQDRQTLDRAQGGLGLGLAIVRSLVELHGGSVAVDSKGRGHGSRFILRLPLTTRTPVSAAAVTRRARTGEAAGARGGALIVDDNVDAAAMLAAFVETIGFESRVAHDGPAALQAIDEGFAPRLARLDLGLPVIDGYELGQRLRRHPRLGGVRLVAVTGYGQAADRARSRAVGFDGHLVKPVDLARLDALIDELVGARNA
jgi:CheY-like chemotaxis protein